jgi:capsular polysaccharide biosynthesis protein/Mrp family chromosome partitioning ATPase
MSAHTDRGERGHGLAHFAGNIRERWWVILATMLVLGAVAFAVSSFVLQPRYSATAQVAYSQRDADAVSKALSDSGTAGLPKTLSSDALVLQTSTFAERVSQRMGGAVSADAVRSSISISTVAGVEVIHIRAAISQSDLAANVANACADEFIRTRREEIQGLLRSALDFVQGRIDSLTPAEQNASTGVALEQQRYALDSLLSSALADYKVLEKASVPASPYFPRPYFNLLLGLAAGLALGLVLALLMSSLDSRIKDQTTLESVMELPVLGTMPAASGRRGAKSSGRNAAVGFRKGDEPLLESMSILSSNVKALGFGDSSRSMLIAGTGDDTRCALAVNLTLSMALAGDRVILVDADLRNPTVDQCLGIPNEQGLGDALTDGDLGWSDRIQAVDVAPFVDPLLMSDRAAEATRPSVSKFLCLTSGTLPLDPDAVLESSALRMLLSDLQGYSDYVIVSGPPMVPGSDSLLLARSVDTVILSGSLGRQTTAEARQTRHLLARAEIQALGLVICGTKSQGREAYYIYPGYERSASTRRG